MYMYAFTFSHCHLSFYRQVISSGFFSHDLNFGQTCRKLFSFFRNFYLGFVGFAYIACLFVTVLQNIFFYHCCITVYLVLLIYSSGSCSKFDLFFPISLSLSFVSSLRRFLLVHSLIHLGNLSGPHLKLSYMTEEASLSLLFTNLYLPFGMSIVLLYDLWHMVDRCAHATCMRHGRLLCEIMT